MQLGTWDLGLMYEVWEDVQSYGTEPLTYVIFANFK